MKKMLWLILLSRVNTHPLHAQPLTHPHIGRNHNKRERETRRRNIRITKPYSIRNLFIIKRSLIKNREALRLAPLSWYIIFFKIIHPNIKSLIHFIYLHKHQPCWLNSIQTLILSSCYLKENNAKMTEGLIRK